MGNTTLHPSIPLLNHLGGSTILFFRVTSWVTISRLNIIIPLSSFISMKKASSGHFCFIFFAYLSNNDKIGRGFPPTSGQIPQTSGSSN